MYNSLWRIFLPIFVAAAMSAGITTLFGQGDMWWLPALGTLFIGTKMMFANRMVVGHGVSGKPHWLGMPRFMCVYYGILLLLIIPLDALLFTKYTRSISHRCRELST